MTARTILLVSGSLRARSTNTAVLRTALEVAPVDISALLYDGLGLLPTFDPDLDVDPLPPVVADLRRQIHSADALVFSTPEYAGALPGGFKNLLDWTIGDDKPGSIYGKTVAWLNTSPRGAAGAHQELRTVLGYAGARLVEAACLNVPVSSAMIGDNGTISDIEPRTRIAEALRLIAEEPPGPSSTATEASSVGP